MEVGNGQQVRLAIGKPLGARQTLALRAVPVAASNGQRPLAALDKTAAR
jgi:hypothetical protein